jgi:hypothetical protein
MRPLLVMRLEFGGLRHRHQLDSPIGRCAVIVFTVPGAEIDRRRWTSAFLASQARQQFPKTHIAALLDHQPHRIERHAPAAMQFELEVRPVGQAMLRTERRRMHRGRLQREHKKNKRVAGVVAVPTRFST